MDSAEILKALERERELLEDFIRLSEEQLLSIEPKKLNTVDSLLAKRANLMMELMAIEATLATWIGQFRSDPSISSEVMHELRSANHEIVSIANHIIDIDEQTNAHLDALKYAWQAELQGMNRRRRGKETARIR
jgi:hypothetical protein